MKNPAEAGRTTILMSERCNCLLQSIIDDHVLLPLCRAGIGITLQLGVLALRPFQFANDFFNFRHDVHYSGTMWPFWISVASVQPWAMYA